MASPVIIIGLLTLLDGVRVGHAMGDQIINEKKGDTSDDPSNDFTYSTVGNDPKIENLLTESPVAITADDVMTDMSNDTWTFELTTEKPHFGGKSKISEREKDILERTYAILSIGYATIVITIGIVGNIMNLLTLLSRDMGHSTSNIYLSTLAFVDLVYLLSRIPGLLKDIVGRTSSFLAFYRMSLYVSYPLSA